MKLIVGLGNPGPKYESNRHNVGFMALDYYLKHFPGVDPGIFKEDKRSKSLVVTLGRDDDKVILLKPQTYMNKSGQAVRACADYFGIAPKNTLVIYDELALPFGTIRARQGGESAGHNGIKSVISHYGEDFARLRVGIANQYTDKQDQDKFVLSNFREAESDQLPKIFDKTNDCIDSFINGKLSADTFKLE